MRNNINYLYSKTVRRLQKSYNCGNLRRHYWKNGVGNTRAFRKECHALLFCDSYRDFVSHPIRYSLRKKLIYVILSCSYGYVANVLCIFMYLHLCRRNDGFLHLQTSTIQVLKPWAQLQQEQLSIVDCMISCNVVSPPSGGGSFV